MHFPGRFALLASLTLSISPMLVPATSVADPMDASPSVRLRWTAPGDDGTAGRATAYDLRYSTSTITAANFAQATQVIGEPAPAVTGSAESFTVSGLSNGITYFFAVKTQDDASNWSAVSNMAVRAAAVSTINVELTLAFSAPYPNPTNIPTRMDFALPKETQVQIDAFDIQGRHVRTIIEGIHPAGHNELVWDLKDSVGRRVNAGVYLVRGKLGDRTFNQRLVVVQ